MAEFDYKQRPSAVYRQNWEKVFQPCPRHADANSPESPLNGVDGFGLPSLFTANATGRLSPLDGDRGL